MQLILIQAFSLEVSKGDEIGLIVKSLFLLILGKLGSFVYLSIFLLLLADETCPCK